MPSIPQSLLWISLVVLWLFVLVPMLINKRDTVRRTSDVALATRVLSSRLIRRSGPAAGHRHDPAWRRSESDLDPTFDSAFEAGLGAEFESRFAADSTPGDEALTEQFVVAEVAAEDVAGGGNRQEPARARTRSLVVIAAVTEQSDPNYLDVEFVEENSGALPIGAMTGVQGDLFEAGPEQSVQVEPEPTLERAEEFVTAEQAVPAEPVREPVSETVSEPVSESVSESAPGSLPGSSADGGDDYEYIEDTSGLEAAEEPATPGRRRRMDSTATAAAVSARKYRFRKRVLMTLSAIMMLTAVLSSTVSSSFWWSCGSTGVVTVLYLAYLRRQTRIEEQVRRRRQQRMSRSRGAGEETVGGRVVQRDHQDFDVVPTRLQRPGAVVLDIDDEDPIFEHLDEVPHSRSYHHDLPRAAGQ
ncbi:MAG: hypothetical protein KDB71_07790 [Mycobacterium sp.]|nr:hypothetical protein [Mycobacterium sp.]